MNGESGQNVPLMPLTARTDNLVQVYCKFVIVARMTFNATIPSGQGSLLQVFLGNGALRR